MINKIHSYHSGNSKRFSSFLFNGDLTGKVLLPVIYCFVFLTFWGVLPAPDIGK